jgi:protease PrsW
VNGLEVFAGLTSFAVSAILLTGVLAAVWWFDRYDREPVHLVLMVFAWGAVAAPPLAISVEALAEAVMNLSGGGHLAGLVGAVGPGPPIEELLKAIGVLAVVAMSRHFDNPADGIVYGTAVGLGFALTENLLYLLSGLLQGGGASLVELVLLRTVFSAGVHALSSAAFGGLLGYAYLSRTWLRRVGWVILGATAACVLHVGWNLQVVWLSLDGPASPVLPWLALVPALYAAYVAVFALLLARESRVLRSELGEEVALGVLPGWVVEVMPFYWQRVRGRWWPSRAERTVIARLLTRLAFRKHALRRLPADESALAGLEVVGLRQQIRGILEPDRTRERDMES